MWFRCVIIILVFLNILGALLLWNLRQENNKFDIIWRCFSIITLIMIIVYIFYALFSH